MRVSSGIIVSIVYGPSDWAIGHNYTAAGHATSVLQRRGPNLELSMYTFSIKRERRAEHLRRHEIQACMLDFRDMKFRPICSCCSDFPHPVRGLVTTHLTRLTGPDETVLAGHARVGLAPAPTDKPVTKQLNI